MSNTFTQQLIEAGVDEVTAEAAGLALAQGKSAVNDADIANAFLQISASDYAKCHE